MGASWPHRHAMRSPCGRALSPSPRAFAPRADSPRLFARRERAPGRFALPGARYASCLATSLVLALLSAIPSHAAAFELAVERIADGARAETVTFSEPRSADGFASSEACLRLAVDAPGAAWKIIVRTTNSCGRPGLHPTGTESADPLPIYWQVHDLRAPPPGMGSGIRESWALLRDQGEAGWLEALERGEPVLASGASGAASLAPWPVAGRSPSSPFYAHLAADASRAIAGEYAATITVDLIFLADIPPTGGGRPDPFTLPPRSGGYRVRGNAVSLVSLHPVGTRAVEYAYRPVPGDSWTPCVPLAGTTNPDTRPPHWGILWDIAGLSPGLYDVRALATDPLGRSDTDPAVLRILRSDDRFALIGDWDPGEDIFQERLEISTETSATLRLFDGSSVGLPHGAFPGQDSVWLEVTRRGRWPLSARFPLGRQPAGCLRVFAVDPGSAAGSVATPGRRAAGGAAVDAGGGPASLASASTVGPSVTLVVPWDPSLPASALATLALFRLDPVTGAWMPVPEAWADTVAGAFSLTGPAGTYAVFAAAAASDVGGAYVYPNPFVPFDGIAANGVPWTPGDPASGIVFGNLPDPVQIDVFSIQGSRVASLARPAPAGTLRWDARNEDGRELASGMYVARIRGPAGDAVMRKILIIR